MLLRYIWKAVGLLIVGFGLLSLVLVFAARTGSQYICVQIADGVTSSPDNQYLLDINTGISLQDTRHGSIYLGVVAPDGKHYVDLQSVKGGIGLDNLFVYSPDDDTRILIESGVFPDYSNSGLASYVRWSPDGNRIAYLWQGQDKQMKLSVVNADGSAKQTVDISPPEGSHVASISSLLLNAWSADSTYLSVAVRDVNNGFWLWATNPLQQLHFDFDNQQLERGTWSAVGHTFAAVQLGDHSQLLLITPGASPEVVHADVTPTSYEQITWSPDNRDLALSGVARRCDDPSCTLYWRYDIFSSEGTTLQSGIWGHPSSVAGNSSYYITGPGGQIAMSGHTLTANWLPQGHTWVYMQEQGTDDKPSLNWVGLDAETGKAHIIIRNVAEDYADSIAVNRTNQYLNAPSSFDTLPSIYRSSQILIPVWQDGKMNLVLSDLDGGNQKTIVAGADAFINPSSYNAEFSFWLWDEFAVIIWATGSTAHHYHMTLLNTDQSQSYELPLDFQSVPELSWPTLNWISFTAQVDGLNNLYIASLRPGEWHELVHDMGSSSESLASPNDQNGQVALVYTSPGAPVNTLYVMPIAGGPSQKIANDLSGFVSWSPDNSQIAFIQGKNSPASYFTVAKPDTSILMKTPLRKLWGSAPYIVDWTKCT